MRIDPDQNCPYSSGNSAFGDVVLSSRARLARNLDGFPFVNRSSEADSREVIKLVRGMGTVGPSADALEWIDLEEQSPVTRRMLTERHLVSSMLADATHPAAVAVGPELCRSIMVNEEDHLRIQSIRAGLAMEEVRADVDALDDRLEEVVAIAFHPRWGYLSACPTNVGTGVRFSVLLHLPGLRIIQDLERIYRACRDTNMAIRGYHGEGSDTVADLYQVSNQVTLGSSAEELLVQLSEHFIPDIIKYERRARMLVVEREVAKLDDRTHRALGILREARLLTVDESMNLLGRLRLGVCMDRLPEIDVNTINQLFIDVQQGHVAWRISSDLDDGAINEARAALLREKLAA